MAEHFDLAIAWDWEYDYYFVYQIEEILQSKNISTYRIEEHNYNETYSNLKKHRLKFSYLLDRSSENYENVARYAEKTSVRIINPYSFTHKANDKATMHLEFITGGINVPYTIIVSPYNKNSKIEFSISDLHKLGRPFIIKPANNTGGGLGVVTGAETLYDVISARQTLGDDKYLIQEKIEPKYLDNKRAWFRCFYAFKKIFITWWDDLTHRYELVNLDQEQQFKLYRLKKLMSTIHRICKLDFFSSEIAITNLDKLVVVDYVNDICDMRRQSEHYDGVPDILINEIINKLANFIKYRRN